MFFDINESYTAGLCEREAQFSLRQMNRLDSEISGLSMFLESFPDRDCPAPENREQVRALQDKIDFLSSQADDYERMYDYWLTQKRFALLREEKNENTMPGPDEIQGKPESA